MYESLLKHCDEFNLYVFAFDDKCYNFLKSQNYKCLTVISLKEFEDIELLKIKPTRTAVEYCWTCTSSTILYAIKTFGLDHCTYIDADLCFYQNPYILIKEMGSKSVLITEHRYTKSYDQSTDSGKYCVQFVSFKNDSQGMKVLQWWREACIEWCYARVEDGKFGDQKYLDSWTSNFEGVHELKHLGGGIAPWNFQQYFFVLDKEKLKGIEIKSQQKFDAIFFHFHGLKFFDGDIVSLSSSLYELNENVKTMFYKTYINSLNSTKEIIKSIDSSLNSNGIMGKSPMKPMSMGLVLKFYFYDLKKSFRNILGRNLKQRIKHHYFYDIQDFKSLN